MILHERFCKMNIKYCFQCKEKIPIEEYEEHIKNHNEKKPEDKEDEFKNEIIRKDVYENSRDYASMQEKLEKYNYLTERKKLFDAELHRRRPRRRGVQNRWL